MDVLKEGFKDSWQAGANTAAAVRAPVAHIPSRNVKDRSASACDSIFLLGSRWQLKEGVSAPRTLGLGFRTLCPTRPRDVNT